MFLCVSANPAIDKQVRITELRVGAVNRAAEAIAEPGGKAAHAHQFERSLFSGRDAGDLSATDRQDRNSKCMAEKPGVAGDVLYRTRLEGAPV